MIIEPIQDLKIHHLGNHNPRLHTDEILMALSICAVTNPGGRTGHEAAARSCAAARRTPRSSSLSVDDATFRKLGMNLTCEAKYQTKKLYHKK